MAISQPETPEADPGEPTNDTVAELMKLPGVGVETAKSLWSKGITSAKDLQGQTLEGLGKVKGFTEEQTKKLLAFVHLDGVVDTASGTLSKLVEATLSTAKTITTTATDTAGKAMDMATDTAGKVVGSAGKVVGSASAMVGLGGGDGEEGAGDSLPDKLWHELKGVPDMTREKATALYNAGFTTGKQILAASTAQIAKVQGFTEDMAHKVMDFVKNLMPGGEEEETTE